MVSISGMTVSIKTDLWFPITGQQGHGSRNIHQNGRFPVRQPDKVVHIRQHEGIQGMPEHLFDLEDLQAALFVEDPCHQVL